MIASEKVHMTGVQELVCHEQCHHLQPINAPARVPQSVFMTLCAQGLAVQQNSYDFGKHNTADGHLMEAAERSDAICSAPVDKIAEKEVASVWGKALSEEDIQ